MISLATIDQQISAHGAGIASFLSHFEPSTSFSIWHSLIRKAEEFINLVEFEIDDPILKRRIRSLPLDARMADDPQLGIDARAELERYFDIDVAHRFQSMVFELTMFGVSMKDSGRQLSDGFMMTTVADGVQYLQSRRRHFVAILYLINETCVGSRPIGQDGGGVLTALGPMVEH